MSTTTKQDSEKKTEARKDRRVARSFRVHYA